jgi:hypothetical protein
VAVTPASSSHAEQVSSATGSETPTPLRVTALEKIMNEPAICSSCGASLAPLALDDPKAASEYDRLKRIENEARALVSSHERNYDHFPTDSLAWKLREALS